MKRDDVAEAVIHVREYAGDDPVALEYWARMLGAEVVRLRRLLSRQQNCFVGSTNTVSHSDQQKQGGMKMAKNETTESDPSNAETLREQYERQEAYKRQRAAEDDD